MTAAVAVRANGHDVATYDAVEGVIRVPTQVQGVHLTFAPGQRVLTDQQMVLLSPLGIKADFDPRQVAVFLMDCQNRGFDPWANEAYLMKYPGDKYVRHIGIAGFRKRGESTGTYRGRIQAVFCDTDGKWLEVWSHRDRPPYAAKVGIRREGFPEPEFVVALYDEYVPMHDEYEGRGDSRKKTGRRVPTPNWRAAVDGGKPTVMLSKCAEAAAWRAAFPERFNGFYAPEEFERESVQQRGDDPGAAKRRAAYAAAHGQGTSMDPAKDDPVGDDPGVVEGTTVEDETTRALLFAELDEQAEVLGRSVDALCERWSASRDGRKIDTATVTELADLVHRIRPYVLAALQDAGRDDEADQYEKAPHAATVEDLFGRGPAVPEPTVDDVPPIEDGEAAK